MNFDKFKTAVQEQFRRMAETADNIFVSNVNGDALWDLYLSSFPEGTNPVYRERTEHDCQCCRHFIRHYGGIVTVVNNELVSIWDIRVGGAYQVVADALSKRVKSKIIRDIFVPPTRKLGTDKNRSQLEDDSVITFDHFYLELPNQFKTVNPDQAGSILSEVRSNKEVFRRSLNEITIDAVDTVLDLISQNSLYRGEEHKRAVTAFKKHLRYYNKIPTLSQKNNFCWDIAAKVGGSVKIRNSAIGTLLVDISEDNDLDASVRSFENMVAPANYKRPNALITKRMIVDAKTKIDGMGFTDSLLRRYAVADDITINNVLFANRDSKITGDIFDELSDSIPINPKEFKRVEEVSILDFINNVLPSATSLELLLENRHCDNLVSLIAPVNNHATSMFKWDNGFSWTYTGDIADSIKQRVKAAGGNVDGVLRCSLSWYNTDDLDIHVVEPSGNRIYFGNKRNRRTTGILDVDMNASSCVTDAVENITWSDEGAMAEGKYRVYVNNYCKRASIDFGFEVEIEYKGEVFTVSYDKLVRNGENVEVAKFNFSRKNGIKFTEKLDSKAVTKEVWGVNTNSFQNVSMMMMSPNHWEGEVGVGNKHYFFMLEGCANEETSRGFFNEFLKEDLLKQKRVFEALGSKMLAQPSDDQLSGIGFSSTKRESVLCKVGGSFSRVVKINF